MASKLTARQRKFCHEYMLGNNGTRAATRSGYSEQNAAYCSHRLLQKPAVKTYLAQLQEEERQKYKITSEMIVRELALIAFTDVSEFYNEDKTLKDLKDIPPDKRRAIAGIQTHKTVTKNHMSYNVNFKTHNKTAALLQLAKHVGLYKEQLEEDKMVKVIYIDTGDPYDPDKPHVFKDLSGRPLDQEEARQSYEEFLAAKNKKNADDDPDAMEP